MGQSAVLLQNTMLSDEQVATHSTAPPAGMPPAPPASAEIPARCKPQHFGAAGSLQSVGAVQSTMILPDEHVAPHLVEKSVVLVQQC